MSDLPVPQTPALTSPETEAVPAPQFQAPPAPVPAEPAPQPAAAVPPAIIPFSTAPDAPPPVPKRLLTQKQKAAVIVRLLLKEGVELNLDNMPEAVQLDLIHEMGTLKAVDKATLEAVIHEFVAEMKDIGAEFPNGVEGALDLLDSAFSPDAMKRLRLKTGIVVQGDPWDAVETLENDALAQLILQESTETGAIILSKLSVPKSAAVLALLPGDRARTITYAVSTTSSIDPETVRTIGHAIATQIATKDPKAFSEAPDRRVGEILNQSRTQTRDALLDGLVAEDEEFADAVRKSIFTFPDIQSRINPPDIAKLTRAVDQQVFSTALAYAQSLPENRPTVDFIFDNMAKRMANQVREDMQDIGNVTETDGETAINTMMAAIKDLEQAGEIVLNAASA